MTSMPASAGQIHGLPLPHEQLQRRALRRMKLVASGTLVLMTAAFLAAQAFEQRWPWLAWVRAFAEAAMVGGLADWFAVTALFRHPLGIPIPHTAIVPNKKERIGEDLGTFVQRNFLSEEVLLAKLEQINAAQHIARWLSAPSIAGKLAERVVLGTNSVLASFHDKDVRHFLERNLSQLVKSVKAAPLAGALLDTVISSDQQHEVPQLFLRGLERLIDENEEFLRESVQQEMPWYIPKFMQGRLFKWIALKLKTRLHAINTDPAHPIRRRMEEEIQEFIHGLKTSGEYLERGELIKARLLQSPAVQKYLSQLAHELREKGQQLLTDDPQARDVAARAIIFMGQQLNQEPVLQHKLNAFLASFARGTIRKRQKDITGLIAGTVHSWDTKTIVEKIELHVGRDLQYIRLNGTFVGGLVGLLIHGIGLLVAG